MGMVPRLRARYGTVMTSFEITVELQSAEHAEALWVLLARPGVDQAFAGGVITLSCTSPEQARFLWLLATMAGLAPSSDGFPS